VPPGFTPFFDDLRLVVRWLHTFDCALAAIGCAHTRSREGFDLWAVLKHRIRGRIGAIRAAEHHHFFALDIIGHGVTVSA
jgi:hypothetical protein